MEESKVTGRAILQVIVEERDDGKCQIGIQTFGEKELSGAMEKGLLALAKNISTLLNGGTMPPYSQT